MANNTPYTGNYIYGANGIIIPDTAVIQETVQTEFRNALGQDLSLEESTPQGRLIDVETSARSSVINFNAQIANILINISMSSGSALDAWGANFNIPREGAKPSTVPVLITGIKDTVIPAGAEAATKQGIIWKAESEIIIEDDGTATGDFICSLPGPNSLGIGELDTIVASPTTGIDGWETITNTAIAIPGNLKESDASYKRRILNSIFSGTALFGNYASACYKVKNVQDVFTYDNPTGSIKQLDNISIPAHSVFVCVDGGEASEIASALYSVKSAGCGWCGNTPVVVTDKDYNTTNTVIYNMPEDIYFTIEIDVTNMFNSSSNLSEDIQNVIINYFNGEYIEQGYNKISIRALIDPFVIGTLLKSQINSISINSIKVGLEIPAPHAVASIIKASITKGIEWASVDSTVFGAKVLTNGTYIFVFDGTNWTLDGETITLSDYGINVSGVALTNDKISILYSTGELSINPIQIFATETARIQPEKIKVVING